MEDKNIEEAIMIVLYKDGETIKQREQFPIWYSREWYPKPENFMDAFEKALRNHLLRNPISVELGKLSVELKAPDVVQRFLDYCKDKKQLRPGESLRLPGFINRAPVILITFQR